MKQALLKLAIVCCFILSYQTLRSFWENNVPVTSENECLILRYTMRDLKVKILSNDIKLGESRVLFIEADIAQDMDFASLRALDATGVDCL